MGEATFVEARCAVGGCACPRWADWNEARREFAKAHPRAAALDAIVDETAYSEALDALAEDLDAAYAHPAPACTRPGCAYAPAIPGFDIRAAETRGSC